MLTRGPQVTTLLKVLDSPSLQTPASVALAAQSPPSHDPLPRTGGKVAPPGRWIQLLGLLYLFSTPLDLIQLPVRSPTTLLGGAFLFVWGIAFLRGRYRLPPHPWAIAFAIAFVAWSALTISWSVVPAFSMTQSISTAMLVISVIAIASVFRGAIREPLWALLAGSLALAMDTVFLGGRQIYYVAGMALESQQYTISGVDENALSLHLTIGIAAAIYLIRTSRAVKTRILLIGFLSFLVVTVVVVGSRSAVGALIGMAILTILASARSISTIVWSVLLVAISLLPVKLLADAGMIPSRIIEWISNPVANDSRLEIIATYRLTMADWFWKGVGTGGDAYYLQAVASIYKNAHSAFWKTWIETGIVGLVIWLGFVVATFVIAVRSSRRFFFILVSVPVFIYFYTLGPVNSNMLWAVFGLAVGVPLMKSTRRESRAVHPVSPSGGLAVSP